MCVSKSVLPVLPLWGSFQTLLLVRRHISFHRSRISLVHQPSLNISSLLREAALGCDCLCTKGSVFLVRFSQAFGPFSTKCQIVCSLLSRWLACLAGCVISQGLRNGSSPSTMTSWRPIAAALRSQCTSYDMTSKGLTRCLWSVPALGCWKMLGH